MQYPQVEIRPGEPIHEADVRVENAYEALGGVVLAFDNLNSFLPISQFCHFFQVGVADRQLVLVVMTGEWDEKTLLTVLNVLLEIRMDPDPPGHTPLFRFHSLHPPPAVLLTLFGDSAVSDFECRAALVAHFGKDLAPSRALQFAAAAANLLRESLGITTDFYDSEGEIRVGHAVAENLRAENLPQEGAPLNALISLGFLYGEILRQRFPYESRWVELRDQGPWPVLVFGQAPAAVRNAQQGGDGAAEKAPGAATEQGSGVPQVVFNPLGSVVALYQEGDGQSLRSAADDLRKRLHEELKESTQCAEG